MLTNVQMKPTCVKPRPSALNMTLPAFVAQRCRRSRYRPSWYAAPASASGARAQQQIRRTPLLLSIDGTDRRRDERAPDCYIDRPPHTMRAA